MRGVAFRSPTQSEGKRQEHQKSDRRSRGTRQAQLPKTNVAKPVHAAPSAVCMADRQSDRVLRPEDQRAGAAGPKETIDGQRAVKKLVIHVAFGIYSAQSDAAMPAITGSFTGGARRVETWISQRFHEYRSVAIPLCAGGWTSAIIHIDHRSDPAAEQRSEINLMFPTEGEALAVGEMIALAMYNRSSA